MQQSSFQTISVLHSCSAFKQLCSPGLLSTLDAIKRSLISISVKLSRNLYQDHQEFYEDFSSIPFNSVVTYVQIPPLTLDHDSEPFEQLKTDCDNYNSRIVVVQKFVNF